ncbi:MAG: crossover junction endodeoxyribonuclease RuvC [Candidatus Moranbacteria bacterium]|nr:crossover junction endodeoxyribonuclease RuvC [Candidatus Moranbacteria bacterium]
MKILGIDPGTATTGWAVTEKKDGAEIKAIAYGHISTQPQDSDWKRLKEITQDIKEIIHTHKPDEAAVESLFFFKNVKTAMTVSQARGAILLAITQEEVPLYEYTPLQIKQALTGYGQATKKQVQSMVQRLLKLEKPPTPDDTADAIAITICHHQSRKLQSLLNK